MDDQTNTNSGATQPVDNTQTEQTNQILENLNEVAPVENNVLNTDQDDTAFKAEAFEPTSIPTPTLSSSSSDSSTSTSDLAELKKKALNELSPLVQLLDQEPSDKFKTLMMMIQTILMKDLIGIQARVVHIQWTHFLTCLLNSTFLGAHLMVGSRPRLFQ